MDNVKFSKLCRETKVIGRGLTPASVDITFSKVKPKGGRAIDFAGFQEALQILASEKYSRDDPATAFDKIIALIERAGGPKTTGTSATATKGNIYDRLTDTRGYTGAHKQRFDASGRGRGAAGRRGDDGVSDLSQITRPGMR
jgi:hypothetical protein